MIDPYLNRKRNLFDNVMKPYGGTLHKERTKGPVWSNLQIIKQDFSFDRALKTSRDKEAFLIAGLVFWDYVDNTSINAVAFTKDSFEFIGLFTGMPLIIHDYFSGLFSSTEFMPEIGNVSKETSTKDELELYFRQPIRRKYGSILPKCDIRKRAADLLANIAIIFILHHEFGHIIDCHVEYIGRQFNHYQYFESPYLKASEEETNNRRCLELGADIFGLDASLRLWKVYHEDKLVPEFGDLHYLTTWFMSMMVTFMLTDLEGKPADYNKLSHPHPVVRALNSVFHISEQLQNFQPDLLNVWDEAWQRGVDDVSRIWRLYDIPAPNFRSISIDYETSLLSLRDQLKRLELDYLARLKDERLTRRSGELKSYL